MSKKHFEAAAEYIRGLHVAARSLRSVVGSEDNQRSAANLEARAAGAEDVCLKIFGDANPRFDSCRFIEACRPE